MSELAGCPSRLDVQSAGCPVGWMSSWLDVQSAGCLSRLDVRRLDVFRLDVRVGWTSSRLDVQSAGCPFGWISSRLDVRRLDVFRLDVSRLDVRKGNFVQPAVAGHKVGHTATAFRIRWSESATLTSCQHEAQEKSQALPPDGSVSYHCDGCLGEEASQ